MNKLIMILLVAIFVVGCASKPTAAAKPVATTPFTAAEIGDSSPLEEVAAVDDEAVEDLPDMVAS